MTDSTPRVRFGTTKVRSGCTTCKSRHLKCDEGRPACQRCISGRRKCDFAINDTNARSATDQLRIVRYVAQLPQAALSPQPAVTQQEARSLEFFQLMTAPELGGALSGEAWSRFTLQACHEKAVLHAVVALSSLHEYYKQVDNSSGSGADFSTEQYNKAIQQIVKLDFAKSTTATDVALITCLLFAFFESLRGHYKSAVTHINSGIKILSELPIWGSIIGRSSDAYPLSVYLFRCMETQMLEICDRETQYLPSKVSPDVPITFPAMFSSVQEATKSMENLRSTVLRFSEYCEGLTDLTNDIQALIDKRYGELAEDLENWSMAFDSMLTRYSQTGTSNIDSNNPEVLLLKIHKAASKIGLRVTRTSMRNTLDIFGPEFRAITRDAARFIGQSAPVSQQTSSGEPARAKNLSQSQSGGLTATDPSLLTKGILTDEATSHLRQPALNSPYLSPLNAAMFPNIPGGENDSIEMLYVNDADESTGPRPAHALKPSFSVGLGIIMPLFIVCAYCRESQTRHQALHLLKICNRKEGIWDSQLTARVVEMVINLEEREAFRQSQRSGLHHSDLFPPGSQIPECARVRFLSIEFAPEKQAIIRYRHGEVDATSDISLYHEVDGTRILQW